MIYSYMGKPAADYRMHRLTYKQIAQRSRTYRTTQRLLAALKK